MKLEKYPIDGQSTYEDSEGRSYYMVLSGDIVYASVIAHKDYSIVLLRTGKECTQFGRYKDVVTVRYKNLLEKKNLNTTDLRIFADIQLIPKDVRPEWF